MSFYYQVFGLTCKSTIEIPAFFPIKPGESAIDFQVEIGKVLPEFSEEVYLIDEKSRISSSEFFMEVPQVAKYWVQEGKNVIIEPLTNDMRDVLLYFKSNCMAAILFQRGKIPFHVSGIEDPDGGVWLFSAESGTGKSTTALKLQEKGYSIFTDDTALVYMENGRCLTRASYPMLRAWPETIHNQKAFLSESSFQLIDDWEKRGLYFHNGFINQPREVKGIFFLKAEGDEISIKKLGAGQGLVHLLANVYRGEWAQTLKQMKLQFDLASQIAKKILFLEAKRPEKEETYDAFAEAIEAFILKDSKENGHKKVGMKLIA